MAAPASTDIPPLPSLSSDVVLAVLTHRSVRGPRIEDGDDEIGDAQRFTLVGATVKDLLVTETLFRYRPLLTQDQLRNQREQVLSDKSLDRWLTAYRLRQKVIVDRAAIASLSSADESRALFNAYFGAVFTHRGISVAREWIAQLVNPVLASQVQDESMNGA